MVALVRGEDEHAVRAVDSVLGEPREERRECLVIRLQLLDVIGLARSPRVGVGKRKMRGVGVRDVAIRHRHAVLLHLRDVAERVVGRHLVETGERIDRRAVHRSYSADGGRDVFVSEQALVAGVAARLVGQQVRSSVTRARAHYVAVRAVDGDADEVSNTGLSGVRVAGRDLGRLRRG